MLPRWAEDILEQAKGKVEDLDSMIVHQQRHRSGFNRMLRKELEEIYNLINKVIEE